MGKGKTPYVVKGLLKAGTATDEGGSGWKAAVSALANPLRQEVRDSAGAFGPLKSVTGRLCFILENYDVRFPCNIYPQYSQAPQPTEADKQAIGSLALRLRTFANSLHKPVSGHDGGGWGHGKTLEW